MPLTDAPPDDERVDDPAQRMTRRLQWAVVVLLVLGVAAFLVRGATRPADPSFELPTDRRPLAGFDEVAMHVVTADGKTLDWCALLAATAQARQQGLMGQRDLRGYDAMVFRFDADTVSGFYMFRTLLPLSIAFIAADGAVVSSADMAPCPSADAVACPMYPPAKPYRHAVEAVSGGLPALGIVPSAEVTFPDGGCPA